MNQSIPGRMNVAKQNKGTRRGQEIEHRGRLIDRYETATIKSSDRRAGEDAQRFVLHTKWTGPPCQAIMPEEVIYINKNI
mmetsp:Transcript_18881/g.32482  ORF Transcript_18881/g.32482 Transcript_18881/m.32482 type:complete len:80 (-) Transcript_18881:22-261(-)